MKKIKTFITVLLSCLFIISTMYTASAAVYIEDWGYRFEKINNGSAFEINKYLRSDAVVYVPKSYNGIRITSIGEYAFIDTSVTNVTLGDNITEIKKGAFINVTSLTEIVLNDNLTSIGKLAFSGCTGLSELTIPDGVTQIADDAFDNCDNLVIYCNSNSYAHEYAEKSNIEYVLLDAVTFILGDADGDGDVSILDATVIQRVLVLIMVDSDGMIELRASVDGDELNITHATKIQRFLSEMEVPEPIGTEVTRVLPSPAQG